MAQSPRTPRLRLEGPSLFERYPRVTTGALALLVAAAIVTAGYFVSQNIDSIKQLLEQHTVSAITIPSCLLIIFLMDRYYKHKYGLTDNPEEPSHPNRYKILIATTILALIAISAYGLDTQYQWTNWIANQSVTVKALSGCVIGAFVIGLVIAYIRDKRKSEKTIPSGRDSIVIDEPNTGRGRRSTGSKNVSDDLYVDDDQTRGTIHGTFDSWSS